MTTDVQEPRERASYFAPNSSAQRRFLLSSAPEVLISSAYGKGKSTILCEKAHYLCLRYPGAAIVLARKKRAHMGATTLRTLLEEVVHPKFVAYGWKPAADGGSTLYYPNGSSILCVGLDNPGRARSGSFTAAYVDQAEELDEEEWNAIAGRLRHPIGPYRQLGAACNPDAPTHFLYRKFKPDMGTHVIVSEADEHLPDGRVIPAGEVMAECIISGPTDNYENLPRDYLLRLSRMKGRYRDRFVLGKWVAFEGQVYDIWEPDLHLADRPAEWNNRKSASGIWLKGNPPADWPRFRSIDFGYVNPFACQWFTRDPEGRWILYREIYYTHRTVRDHARQIREIEAAELAALNAERDRKHAEWERTASHEERVRYAMRSRSAERLQQIARKELAFELSVADHDREDMATLEQEGIVTSPAEKDVEAGIQAVYEAMTPYEVDGERRCNFVILRDALVERDPLLVDAGKPTCTAEEIPGLQRAPHKPGKEDKEAPLKVNDHGCDCARYLIFTAARTPEAKLVWL